MTPHEIEEYGILAMANYFPVTEVDFVSCAIDRGYSKLGDLVAHASAVQCRFLKDGLLKAGFMDARSRSFVPWSGSTVDMILRLMCEWKRVESMPRNGDICWMKITGKGRQKFLALESVDKAEGDLML